MSLDGIEVQLADLALEAARAAAALVRERRTHEVTVADTKTSDVDVVTQPDRESELGLPPSKLHSSFAPVLSTFTWIQMCGFVHCSSLTVPVTSVVLVLSNIAAE